MEIGLQLYAFDDFGVLESMAFVHQDHGCCERIKGAVGGQISPSGKYYAFWRMSHYTLKKKTKDQQQQQQCQAAAQPKECRFTLTRSPCAQSISSRRRHRRRNNITLQLIIQETEEENDKSNSSMQCIRHRR